MSTATEKDLKELKREYANLKAHLSELSNVIGNLTTDSLADGQERVRKAGRRSYNRTREAVSSVESTIEDHPVASLAITLGVGFLLAKLLYRD